MRSYSSLLIFETALDSIHTSDAGLNSLVRHVFYPQFRVVEHDCNTHLGETVDVNFEAEGRIELATGLPISRDRIVYLLSQGIYTVQTRTLSTCISEGGICAKCYAASRPLEDVPEVDDIVTVRPLYDRSTEVLYTSGTTDLLTLGTDSDSYEHLLLYVNGQLQDTSTYSVEGTSLRLTSPVPSGTNLVVRYITETRVPFMLCLAETYAGSLLGLKPLPRPLLPVRGLLLNHQIPEGLVTMLIEDAKKSGVIPPSMLEYLGNIEDKLERALFLMTLRSIYSNVQN